MIKRICDRCGNTIKNNYYTIDIYQHEDNEGRITARGAENNINQNLKKTFNREEEYCEECIKEIKSKIYTHKLF